MNIDNGEIYKFDTQEALEVAKEKLNLVELNDQLAKQLAHVHEEQRPEIYRIIRLDDGQRKSLLRRQGRGIGDD